MPDPSPAPTLDLGRLDAVIFDLDGVITKTAEVHKAAWKRVFDDYLQTRADAGGDPFREFTDDDYITYVDGKPRYDGTASFLSSRGIDLPQFTPEDPPEADTVSGVGNRKNNAFRAHVTEHGVTRYDSRVTLLEQLRAAGTRLGLVTSSRNGRMVLEAAGLMGHFEAIVDGTDAATEGMAGKPDPEMFVTTTERLGITHATSAVVEDAQSGVAAGCAGEFVLVIGVNREDQAEALKRHGADVVVDDLAELELTHDELTHVGVPLTPIAELPPAEDIEELRRRLDGRAPAVFLDYDGVLSPIVADPSVAVLSRENKQALRALAEQTPVYIVSGRDTDDVVDLIDLEGLTIAGSHGVDILHADGRRDVRAEEYRQRCAQRPTTWTPGWATPRGVRVERKLVAIARQVGDDADQLRIAGGKKIMELRPDFELDKGKALEYLLGALRPGPRRRRPLYVGDEETDEDASGPTTTGASASWSRAKTICAHRRTCHSRTLTRSARSWRSWARWPVVTRPACTDWPTRSGFPRPQVPCWLSQGHGILSNMSTTLKSEDDIRSDQARIAGLVDELAMLASNLFAGEARFVALIGEFDRLDGWADGTTQSCAHWLNWRLGIVMPAARERARVARRLADLPAIAAAFGEAGCRIPRCGR